MGGTSSPVSAADVPVAVGDEVRLPGAAGESPVAPGPAGIEAVGAPDDLKTEDQSADTRSAAGTPITSKKINMKTGLFVIGTGSFPWREETATGKAHGLQPVGFTWLDCFATHTIGVSPRPACRRSPRPPELPVSVDPLQLLQSEWQVPPFDVKRVRAALRQRGIRRLDIKNREVGIDPEQVRRQLHLRGDPAAVLVLARLHRGVTAILAFSKARTASR